MSVEDFFSQVEGSRPFVLEVEYGDPVPKENGAKWYPNLGWVIDLDDEEIAWLAEEYGPKKYSVGDFFNGIFSGREYNSEPCEDGDGAFTLYDNQQELQDDILDLYDDGRAGFLNASDTGTGKTITTVSTLKKTGARTILVVAPVSILPSWRDTLIRAGDGDKLWILINYESLRKLLLPSDAEKKVKKTKTKNDHRAKSGIHMLNFDVVVFDECHYLANFASLRSKMSRRIATGDGTSDPAFQMWLSATYGKDPTKTTFLYPSLAELVGSPTDKFSVARYEAACKRLGIQGVRRNDKGGLVEFSGTNQDLKKFSQIVFNSDDAFAKRIESKDEQHRELLAIDLNKQERDQYEALWAEFVEEYSRVMQIGDKKIREPEGLAVQIRFRQKAGLLRAPYMVDAIKDMLADGYQVAVSCEFSNTIKLISEKMVERGMAEPAIFTGANKSTREDERLAFQRGQKKVILFSTAEGINLQANEIASGNPSSTPRSLLIAEPRWSPLKMTQIEGRTQRNGEISTAWYAYASGTIESKVINRMIEGMTSISAMRSDSDDKRNDLRDLQKEIFGDLFKKNE